MIRRFESGARMSQAVAANGVAFLAGQVAADTKQDVEGQTAQILADIATLAAPEYLVEIQGVATA